MKRKEEIQSRIKRVFDLCDRVHSISNGDVNRMDMDAISGNLFIEYHKREHEEGYWWPTSTWHTYLTIYYKESLVLNIHGKTGKVESIQTYVPGDWEKELITFTEKSKTEIKKA